MQKSVVRDGWSSRCSLKTPKRLSFIATWDMSRRALSGKRCKIMMDLMISSLWRNSSNYAQSDGLFSRFYQYNREILLKMTVFSRLLECTALRV